MRAPFKPDENDLDVQKLINLIDAEFEPIEIEVTPEGGALESDCFRIIDNKVKHEGGKMILGWQIWKSPFLIEAECHAVWEDNDENLLDLTPKPKGINKILFIEDPRLVYEGKQIDNIRLNITKNKLVDDFIESFKTKFRLQNKGERANHYDLSEILTDSEISEIKEVVDLQIRIEILLNNGGNEHSKCFCDSGRKYKNCHGKDFKKRMKKY